MKNLLYGLLLTGLIAGCKQKVQPSQQTTPEEKKEDTTVNIPPGTATSAARLIVPGKAIGLTSIGEDVQNVINKLGAPDKGDAAMGKAMATWYADHDPKGNQTTIYTERQMGVDDTSRVQQIRITSSWFSTADSIHTESTLNDIRKHFAPKKAATYKEDGKNYFIYTTGQGITFEITADSVCSGIIVHDSSKTAISTYLPFHAGIKQIK
ncbi:hypothetical protein [Chitinophaga sp. MM2321]|uniref:hypothetical protein n=1 Tax=Chitinophaga sp. MM2321 TaxID=3137178 RepID=UPI0032D5A1E7